MKTIWKPYQNPIKTQKTIENHMKTLENPIKTQKTIENHMKTLENPIKTQKTLENKPLLSPQNLLFPPSLDWRSVRPLGRDELIPVLPEVVKLEAGMLGMDTPPAFYIKKAGFLLGFYGFFPLKRMFGWLKMIEDLIYGMILFETQATGYFERVFVTFHLWNCVNQGCLVQTNQTCSGHVNLQRLDQRRAECQH